MPWQADPKRLNAVITALQQHPGSTAPELGRITGFGYHAIYNLLTTLESNGIHLSEDTKGRLYLFTHESRSTEH